MRRMSVRVGLGAVALCCGFMTPSLTGQAEAEPAPVSIKVGHVWHDHQLAMFVAADNAETFAKATGLNLKAVKDQKFYTLYDGERQVADVEIVRVGGGSKMPTALAQGIIDIGFGGVAPVLAAADQGAPVKLISPLHARGDMLVVRPDFPAESWQEFVGFLKRADVPVRIGYKAPIACAKLVFEEALRHEGLSFTGDASKADVKVHMVNVKDGGKLNPSLAAGLIDGYVGNNPFPAVGLEQKILKVVCDLETLPPGTFRNHPCCCIAAHEAALRDKAEAITGLLVLCLQATDLINGDLDSAVQTACRWIGMSEAVERNSIPTSGYAMDADDAWRQCMATWLKAMQGLDALSGKLKTATEPEAARLAYDLSLLEKARKRLGK
ncbi:MAG: ABC transporter substrate-binding protein [Kiritimatiellae bacterium]|nr:ABC transporter substrate-binding protein [Kiritimatiellia bacterium]